jgi:hypothetical protein
VRPAVGSTFKYLYRTNGLFCTKSDCGGLKMWDGGSFKIPDDVIGAL